MIELSHESWRSVLDASTQRGIAVDLVYAAARREELHAELSSIRSNIIGMAGEPFDIEDARQLGIILFEKLELRPVRRKSRMYSVRADDLKMVHHPIIPEILNYRTAISSQAWINSSKETIRAGRIHPTFTPTAIGRIIASHPAVHSIPTPVRSIIVADPGYTLVEADWRATHLYLLANLSSDSELAELLNNGSDPFEEFAAILFGQDVERITAHQRSVAKQATYALLYGANHRTVAGRLGLLEEIVKRYEIELASRFVGVHRWTQKMCQAARKEGFVTTIGGRQLRLPDSQDPRLREQAAINRVLQGSESDILMKVIPQVALMLSGIGGHLLFPLHDEVVTQVPTSEIQTAVGLLRSAMTELDQEFAAPLTVKVMSGPDWGNLNEC
jgi:DNA polymerase-1